MIAHVWSRYTPKHEDDQRRHALAQSTWTRQPWQDRGISDQDLPRLFVERDRTFPYIRDIVDKGCEGLNGEDIIVLTNADIGMVSNACVLIAFALQRNDAGYSFRQDCHERVLVVPSDEQVRAWHHYPGTDLFFFRVGWWGRNRYLMPDMIPAREAWDACFRVLIEATNQNKPLAVPALCWHERHGGHGGSYWEDAANRYTLPGQIHNLRLAKTFLQTMGHDPATFGVR